MGTVPSGEGNQGSNPVESSPPFFSSLGEFFQKKSSEVMLDWEVNGASRVAAAYTLAAVLPKANFRPILIVCEELREAELVFRDLQFFLSGQKNIRPLFFPPNDVSPYVPASPHVTVTAERLEALYALATLSARPLEHVLVVAPIVSLLEKVIAPEDLLKASLRISIGDEVERSLLISHLLEVGYLKANLVEDRGAFAVRGAIVDIFPPLLKNPIRLEFFGDELESIRFFNPENQRTLPKKEGENLEEVVLLPVREISFQEHTVRLAQNEVKKRMDEADIAKADRERISELIGAHIYFPGIEHYLPFFRKHLVSPIAYFPTHAAIQVYLDSKGIVDRLAKFSKELERSYQEARKDNHSTSVIDFTERYILNRDDKPDDSLLKNLGGDQKFPMLRFERLEIEKKGHGPVLRLLSKSHENLRKEMEKARGGVGEPLRPLLLLLEEYRSRGYRSLIVCERKTQAKRLMEMLHVHDVPVRMLEDSEKSLQDLLFTHDDSLNDNPLTLILGELSSGFLLPGQSLAVITEEEIFGPRIHRKVDPKAKSGTNHNLSMVSAFSELSPGDYIVHLDFGVARYLGLEHMNISGTENDFLHLEYKDSDKLYLPVHRLSRIQKYVGAEAENVALDRLGNPASWEKTKQKVGRQIKEVAKELLHLYATRQVAKGHSFSRPNDFYQEFEAEFPFEETPDQERTITEVLDDMHAEKPMDRLVCGDVGFGKTEVAIRAIFLAAMDGYQSAILAPTTVLVHQHFQTLTKRFSGYPVKLGMLSRFATKAMIRDTLKGLADGSIDVVVGTHRLLSSDVLFKRLGLLVVDEEQRFGVKHKERIKLFKKNIDVLTLSATPIPRTLNMTMIGIRDLSVINTPPMDRVSIRTMVCEFDDRVIREAILHELERGGQVYFVHNIVHNIGQMADYLRRLVPEARIAIGHGQMNEDSLEQVMVDFVDHKADVLLCTSIIESGLDISLVNTILINRADKFGLAQLYQIRGRVGRSNRRAYAYLLIPGRYLISEQAQKRLEVLQRHTELGSGFRVASYDLEIRGSGNLLGSDQAGHIKAVGLELYATLMSKALRELKGEKVEEEIDPEIDLRIPAFIPADFISEDNLRLGTYKRLSMLTTEEEVEEMELELKDRFGDLPREVKNLLQVIEIKVMARRAAITKLIFGGSSTTISFDERTNVDIQHLLHLVNTHKGWQLLPDNRLVVTTQQKSDGTIPIDREARVLLETKKLLEKLFKAEKNR